MFKLNRTFGARYDGSELANKVLVVVLSILVVGRVEVILA